MLHSLAQIGLPFIPGWTDLRPFVAELWLVVTVVAVLLTPFFVRRPNLPCAAVAMAGLILALVTLLAVGPAATESSTRFRSMLVADAPAYFWKVLLLLFVMGVVLMWFSTTASTLHEGDGPEFFTLLLGATLGMSLMASASNLLMIFMSVELASLPSYVLAGFRKTHRVGAEASLKYVLFGAATSAIMAYGLSILYGLYGTLSLYSTETAAGHLAGLAEIMARTPGGAPLLVVAVFGLIVGIGFKISAVPFHFWCPDVFEGATIDVSTFLSVASKGAALVLLLRVLAAIAAAAHYEATGRLVAIVGVIGFLGSLTATVGNTAAFAQTNIKRLLAYSSIAHAGYMLCALSLIVRSDSGAPPLPGAMQALLIYLAVYLFMNLGAFTVAGAVYRQTGSEQIADFAGLGRRSPLLAICMTIFLFSLVGLPPVGGFVAKVNLMYVLGRNGGMWWWLVAVIGANTVLSLYYYMRVVRMMFLTDSDEPAFIGHPIGTAVSVACAGMLVLMLVAFEPLNRLAGGYGRLYESEPAKVAQGPADNAALASSSDTAHALPSAP